MLISGYVRHTFLLSLTLSGNGLTLTHTIYFQINFAKPDPLYSFSIGPYREHPFRQAAILHIYLDTIPPCLPWLVLNESSCKFLRLDLCLELNAKYYAHNMMRLENHCVQMMLCQQYASHWCQAKSWVMSYNILVTSQVALSHIKATVMRYYYLFLLILALRMCCGNLYSVSQKSVVCMDWHSFCGFVTFVTIAVY